MQVIQHLIVSKNTSKLFIETEVTEFYLNDEKNQMCRFLTVHGQDGRQWGGSVSVYV